MSGLPRKSRKLEFKGADDNKLVADSWGDPHLRTIVFLHGGGQTRHAWGGTAQRLAQSGWHAIAVDLRGHGESDWTEQYAYQDFAADIVRLVTQLRDRPVIVGASLGGLAALLAQDRPAGALCRALVLVDIAPRSDPQGVERIIGFMEAGKAGFDSLEGAAEAVAGYVRERSRSRDINGLRKNLRQRDDGRWYWHWDPRFIDDARRAPNRPTALFEDAARRLDVPTLLIRGSKSDVLTEDGVEAFRQAVPHARFFDVLGAGHMVAGDRNDAFTGAILSFLGDMQDGGPTDGAPE